MPDALTGFATGAKGNKRKQTVYTPPAVLDICDRLWGSIVLDPCAGPDYSTGAAREYYEGGTERQWLDGTYCNPPYNALQAWLDKSRLELLEGVTEQVLLVPVRPRSAWWLEYMSEAPSRIAWLKRLNFVGYDGSYPESLVLAYTGALSNKFTDIVKASGLANRVTESLVFL